MVDAVAGVKAVAREVAEEDVKRPVADEALEQSARKLLLLPPHVFDKRSKG